MRGITFTIHVLNGKAAESGRFLHVSNNPFRFAKQLPGQIQ